MKKNFTLAPIFKDNMMFQANKPIQIFGTCKKGVEIKVNFLNQTCRLKTKSTEFIIELDPYYVIDKGFSFTVYTKKQEETFNNCLVGDIFLFVGGMNVNLPLKDSKHQEDLNRQNIRFLDVKDAINEDDDDYYLWKTPGIESFGDDSAIAYMFAKEMSKKLETPIGIIACSKGDSSIFSLLGEIDIKSHIGLYNYVEENRDDIDSLNISLLFERVIMKLAPMALNSIVIYQGENDYKHSDLYEVCVSRIIKSYRMLFKDNKLPFVIVQLAGHNYPDADKESIGHIRNVQSCIIDDSKRIFIATAVDIGDKEALILKDKQQIANRISNVVLEKLFNRGKNSISPSYYSYKREEDGIVIYTKNNYLDLVSRSGRFQGFVGTKDGKEFFDLKNVSILKDRIIIKRIQDIREIRYAYDKYPACDIYTTNNLPLLPFKIKLIE